MGRKGAEVIPVRQLRSVLFLTRYAYVLIWFARHDLHKYDVQHGIHTHNNNNCPTMRSRVLEMTVIALILSAFYPVTMKRSEVKFIKFDSDVAWRSSIRANSTTKMRKVVSYCERTAGVASLCIYLLVNSGDRNAENKKIGMTSICESVRQLSEYKLWCIGALYSI